MSSNKTEVPATRSEAASAREAEKKEIERLAQLRRDEQERNQTHFSWTPDVIAHVARHAQTSKRVLEQNIAQADEAKRRRFRELSMCSTSSMDDLEELEKLTQEFLTDPMSQGQLDSFVLAGSPSSLEEEDLNDIDELSEEELFNCALEQYSTEFGLVQTAERVTTYTTPPPEKPDSAVARTPTPNTQLVAMNREKRLEQIINRAHRVATRALVLKSLECKTPTSSSDSPTDGAMNMQGIQLANVQGHFPRKPYPAMERDDTSLSENGSDSSGSRSSDATPYSHTLMIPDGPDNNDKNNDLNRIESFCDMTRNWVRSLSGKLACVSLKTNLLVIVLVVMVIVQSYAMVLLPRRCSTPPAPPAHMPPWCEPLQ